MAEVFKRVNGVKIEKAMAELDGVQLDLAERSFEIYVRAEELLQAARDASPELVGRDRGLDPGVRVTWGQEKDLEYGHLDWFVGLDDRASDFGAMSIEFGREDHLIAPDGRTYGGHEGLYILTRAAGLRIKRRSKVNTKLRRIKVSRGRVKGVSNDGPSS